MSEDGMTVPDLVHPGWCDLRECQVSYELPYGHHQSRSWLVAPEPASDTYIEAHLNSTFPGLNPDTVLMLECALVDHEPVVYPLTLRQARRLYKALGKLLEASRTTTRKSTPAPCLSC